MMDFPLPAEEQIQEPSIAFSFEDVTLANFSEDSYNQWIQKVIEHHQCELVEVQYIFCSDDYLHNINVSYLDHDTLTDIITFPYQAPPLIHSDIFISIDRVKDNAQDRGLSFETELKRVIIHGILHLCGFKDKTESEAQEMRAMEDEAMALFDAAS